MYVHIEIPHKIYFGDFEYGAIKSRYRVIYLDF